MKLYQVLKVVCLSILYVMGTTDIFAMKHNSSVSDPQESQTSSSSSPSQPKEVSGLDETDESEEVKIPTSDERDAQTIDFKILLKSCKLIEEMQNRNPNDNRQEIVNAAFSQRQMTAAETNIFVQALNLLDKKTEWEDTRANALLVAQFFNVQKISQEQLVNIMEFAHYSDIPLLQKACAISLMNHYIDPFLVNDKQELTAKIELAIGKDIGEELYELLFSEARIVGKPISDIDRARLRIVGDELSEEDKKRALTDNKRPRSNDQIFGFIDDDGKMRYGKNACGNSFGHRVKRNIPRDEQTEWVYYNARHEQTKIARKKLFQLKHIQPLERESFQPNEFVAVRQYNDGNISYCYAQLLKMESAEVIYAMEKTQRLFWHDWEWNVNIGQADSQFFDIDDIYKLCD